MNAVENHGGGTPSNGNAPDVTPKANLVIWAYFFGFGIALYVVISLLNIYFRIETDKEAYRKVGSVESQELRDYKVEQEKILKGEQGVVPGKKFISVDGAMIQVLKVIQ